MSSRIFLCLILWFLAIPTTWATSWSPYTDEAGNIYLKSSSIPVSNDDGDLIFLQQPGTLLKLDYRDGNWERTSFSLREWRALGLEAGHPDVRQVSQSDGSRASALLVHRDGKHYHVKLDRVDRDTHVSSQNVELSQRIAPLQSGGGSSPVTTIRPQTEVESTSYSFRVSESGAATIQVPLSVPSGVGGLKPDIGISYSSQSSDGPMGFGWSLNAGSVISRCPPRPSQGEGQKALTFTDSDRLCLDGQRLLVETRPSDSNPAIPYWTAPRYRLELSSTTTVIPLRITAQGPIQGFIVVTQAGEAHYYGGLLGSANTTDLTTLETRFTNLDAAKAVAGLDDDAVIKTAGGVKHTWSRKLIRDVTDNFIVFNYCTSGSQTGCVQTLEPRQILRSIDYTARADLSPHHRIEFHYGPRPVAIKGYQSGQVFELNYILNHIRVLSGGEQVRSLQLRYRRPRSDALEELYYLDEVQECATTNVCRGPIQFDWLRADPATEVYDEYCFNDPSSSIPICYPVYHTSSWDIFEPASVAQTVGTSSNLQTSQFFDMTGDGYNDLVYAQSGRWYIRQGGVTEIPCELTEYCAGSIYASGHYSTTVEIGTMGASSPANMMTIDFNGSGQRALLVANSSSGDWHIIHGNRPIQGDGCSLTLGGSFCGGNVAPVSFQTFSTGRRATGLGNALVADINGDGFEDIVFIENGLINAYVNLGNDTSGQHLGFSNAQIVGSLGSSLHNGFVEESSFNQINDLRSAIMLDVNGNGHTDLLLRVTESQCSDPQYGTPGECLGSGHWRESTITQFHLYSKNELSGLYELQQFLPDMENIRLGDLNGDGLTDIVYTRDNHWYYRISNGLGWMAERQLAGLQKNAWVGIAQLVDLNASGRSEFLFPTSDGWHVYAAGRAVLADAVRLEKRGEITRESGRSYQFVDMSGNGLTDLISATSSSGWRIQRNLRHQVGENKIYSVRETSDKHIEWSYSGLINSGVYHRHFSSQRGHADFPPLAGVEVVAQVRQMTGWLSPTAKRRAITEYKYGGLLVNRQGRGLLGFEFLTVHERDTGIVTQTQYHQQWPLTGQPKATITRQHGRLLASSENTWDAQRTDMFGWTVPVLNKSIEQDYRIDWTSSGSIGPSSLISTTTTNFTYDEVGNILVSESKTEAELGGGEEKRIRVTNQYAAQPLRNIRFARLEESHVKTEYGSETVERTAEFTYHSQTLLLLTEKTPSVGDSPGLSTTYTYDNRGQMTKRETQEVVSGSLVGTPREVSWTYDDTTGARLTETRQNVLTKHYSYEYQNSANRAGPLVAVVETGANGEQSRTTFNPFGKTLLSQARASVQQPFITLATKTYTLCSGDCGHASIYARVSEVHTSGAQSHTYINRLGQVIAESQRLLDGQYSQVRTTYDVRGRPEFVYEPQKVSGANTLAGLSGPRTRYYYTQLNQAYRIDMPGNRTSLNWRTGLWEYQQDPEGAVTAKEIDAFGRTARARDALGQDIEYTYNVHGAVASVKLPGGLEPVTTEYDVFGRRISMTDNDKGDWTYRYNGFGELVEQRKTETGVSNPQTFIETIDYDVFGRKIRTQNADGTVCYTYGNNSASNYARGRLQTIKQYTHATSCANSFTPVYEEVYTYNASGQVLTREVVNHGRSATFSYTYAPTLERLTKTYPAVGSSPATTIEYQYAYGQLIGYRNPATNQAYQTVTGVNARGQVTAQTFLNGVQQLASYDTQTGWMTEQSWHKSGLLRRLSYQHDRVGNTLYRGQDFRSGTGANMDEAFVYDALYRMTGYGLSVAGDGEPLEPCEGFLCPEPDPDPCTVCPGDPDPGDPGEPMFSSFSSGGGGFNINHSYSYDVYGNITWKSDVGKYGAHFSYGQSRPNRLLSVQSGASSGATLYTFSYDGFGNVTNDGKQSFVYSSFDKPLSVTRSSTHASYFAYGPNRELVKQTDIRDDDTTVRYLFGGYEVVELPSGATEHRMHVGGTVITHTESAQGVSTELLFMHTDVQGSTVLITANVTFGDVLRQQLNYDPWGKQALIYTSSQFITGRSLGDSHGYTGHTMVNDFELVHMGGRTYNPVLGRFMQADPFIQAGANLQNYNRYSYVLNNPMSYTDPSGYLFKALKDNWRTLASIALTVLVPGMGFVQGLNLSAGGVGALTGFISGAVATGSLRGAVIGALTGSMFGGLSELGDTLPGVIGHGLVGGMSSMVQGGEFQAGFLSAGLVKAASVAGIMPAVGDNTTRERVANAIVAGTIGGTVSVAAGGKFANGALTAVYSRLLNGMAESQKPDSSGVDSSLTLEERIAAQEGRGWGSYGPLRTAICNTAMEGCTPQSVYSNGLKILPGPGGDGTPFENGAISELFVGPTQHFFNDDTLTVHNVALEGHVLSGIVTRQVVTDSRGWVYIETSKVGPATPLNVVARLVDGAVWRDVDLRIRRMVYHHAVHQQ